LPDDEPDEPVGQIVAGSHGVRFPQGAMTRILACVLQALARDW